MTTNPGLTSVTRTATTIAALAVLVLASPASAQLQYQFADSAGTATSTFSVPVGGTVAIRVYLRDTTGGAPTLNANGGLGSAAVRVSYTNSGVASIANIGTDIVAAVPPWDFGTTAGSVANASGVLNDTIDISPAGALPTSDRIFIGTFTFTANAEGTSNLTAADPNPGNGFDTTHFSNGAGLDAVISNATATITVTPVPEPATVLGIAAVVVLTGRAARRRISRPV